MKKTSGFTIIELMIVIVIAAIGIALAIPSFTDMIERKQLGGATEAAFQHLQRAKSEALKRSKAILVDFYDPGSGGTNWAIGFTDKVAGCNAESTFALLACTVEYDNIADADISDNFLMRIQGSDYKNITMTKVGAGFTKPAVLTGSCGSVTSSTPAEQACFDFRRGLAKTGAYDFASANYKLRVQITPLGNVNVCIPSGEKKMPGYNDCT